MGKIDLMKFPDELFCSEILTRLPLKEAVRFSAVSRKWYRAWTRLPRLKFSAAFFYSIPINRNVEHIISKIIHMQCFALESFELYDCNSFENSICEWLLWISLSGVKSIDLRCSYITMEVPESIFSCAALTSLSLLRFKMTKVPPLFQGFSKLVTCYFEFVEFSEEAFEVILKLSRLLQSLRIYSCRLPSNLRIISSSLKSLALVDVGSNTIKANCPRLESLSIMGCYGLVMVNICSPACVHLETDFRLYEDDSTCSNAGKFFYQDFLQSFSHLEELCIESSFFESYPKGVAELTLRLPNLKTFILNIGKLNYGNDCEKRDVSLFCSSVLKGAPLLKRIRIGMAGGFEHHEFYHFLSFVNNFLRYARDFPKIEISVSRELINPETTLAIPH